MVDKRVEKIGNSTYVVCKFPVPEAYKGVVEMTDDIPPAYLLDAINRPWPVIKNLIIPEGIINIGELAFANNFNLEGVTLPKSLKRIGDRAFSECYKLTKVNIPNVEIIGKQAFYKTKIREIVIPEGVEEICDEAFAYCEYIKKVLLPSTLKRIGNRAFFGCHNLVEIKMTTEKKVGKLEICDEAFGCPIDQMSYLY